VATLNLERGGHHRQQEELEGFLRRCRRKEAHCANFGSALLCALSQRQREAHIKGCLNCVEKIEATGEPTIRVPATRQLPYDEGVLFELREAEVKVERNGQERSPRGDRVQTRVVVKPHEKPTHAALDQLVDLAAGQTDGKRELVALFSSLPRYAGRKPNELQAQGRSPQVLHGVGVGQEAAHRAQTALVLWAWVLRWKLEDCQRHAYE
jgi:hypothetical protein